jgi:hypothetical protein
MKTRGAALELSHIYTSISGRSPHWVKVKNPKTSAVKREAEED